MAEQNNGKTRPPLPRPPQLRGTTRAQKSLSSACFSEIALTWSVTATSLSAVVAMM